MKEVKIWAHRGASGYAPENTLEAFEKAIELHADGIELDIQLTKDGEIVAAHDERLERVSDGTGWIKDYTLSELKKLHFNKTFPGFKETFIPTLKEVYELMREEDMTVNVELKTGMIFYEGMAEKALELASLMGMEEKVIYSSFNHYTLLEIKQKNPEARTGMLFADGIVDAPLYGMRLGADALHPVFTHLQYPDFIRQCREHKLPVHVWTVNTKEDFAMAADKGADVVITNFPDIQNW